MLSLIPQTYTSLLNSVPVPCRQPHTTSGSQPDLRVLLRQHQAGHLVAVVLQTSTYLSLKQKPMTVADVAARRAAFYSMLCTLFRSAMAMWKMN
jgi:hypothetical protein